MNLPQARPSDRRNHDRHPMRTSAVITLPDRRQIAARLLDLGKGGAGVVCDFNLVVGLELSLRMSLPARPDGNAVFEARAVVRNCTLAGSDGGFRLGLEFQPLSAAATAALKGALPL